MVYLPIYNRLIYQINFLSCRLILIIIERSIMETPEKSREVRITQPLPQNKKYKFSPNCILTVALGLFAVVFAWAAHHYFNSIKPFLHLENAKFNKFDNQVKSLSQLAFLFSLYILTISALVFIMNNFANMAHDSPLVMALRRVISNSLEQFIIFIGLYAYVVTQKGMGFEKQELILIGNLFLIARYMYLGGALLEHLTALSFKEAGSVLNLIVILMLLRQILGITIPIIG